jgi:ubiquinone/menaquinone biosynthesis C-methylase UbiE
MTQITLFNNLHNLLACPLCKGRIEFSSKSIKCISCNTYFHQVSNNFLDLLPSSALENEETKWEERLREMENWYKDLATNAEATSKCFISDYTPFIPLLTTLSGDILDIGGGIGVPRSYLLPNTNYIVIDPSLEWLKADWSALVESFPCLENNPTFVRGIGEYLPFSSQSFDVVLSFWSLNHASNPELVFNEVARVLRPGGISLIILEDMIPNWLDLIHPNFPAKTVLNTFFEPSLTQKIFPRLYLFYRLIRWGKWPLQNDHIRIMESEIKDWTASKFNIIQRAWIGQYLTFELRKKEAK